MSEESAAADRSVLIALIQARWFGVLVLAVVVAIIIGALVAFHVTTFDKLGAWLLSFLDKLGGILK